MLALSRRICIALFVSFLLLLRGNSLVYAQKYNFINFTIQHGLIQSQVIDITQNNQNELWLATPGGISRFDGSSFVNYEKSKGLPSNQVQSIATDSKGNIWSSLSGNIVVRYNGLNFRTFRLNTSGRALIPSKICIGARDMVMVMGNNLKTYRLSGTSFAEEPSVDSVLVLECDARGICYAGTVHNGLHVWTGKTWSKLQHAEGDPNATIFKLWTGANGRIRCIATDGIYEVQEDKLVKIKIPFPPNFRAFNIPNVFEDRSGSIWMTFADGGAWQYQNGKWVNYNYNNGLTDDQINTIFEDKDGTLWLGSNGSGLYRYASHYFTYFDRGSGLKSSSVLAVRQNPKTKEILVANGNSGFNIISAAGIRRVNAPENIGEVILLTADDHGRVWFANNTGGLFVYDGNSCRQFVSSGMQLPAVVSFLQYYNGKIWLGGIDGVYSIQHNSVQKLTLNVSNVFTSFYPVNEDSILLGTVQNAYLYCISKSEITVLLSNVNVLCFSADAQNIYIGTDDRGIVCYNRRQKKQRVINSSLGLSCNFVYSLITDGKGSLWAGTGCGIDRISDPGGRMHIRSFTESDGLVGVENNANAAYKDVNGTLWFGTTRGLFHFDPQSKVMKTVAPVVVLQSLKLFSNEVKIKSTDSIIPFENLPYHPVFRPGENHLTFTFKGVYLSNPEKVRYRYELVGADKSFTETEQNTVVFSSLPPGQYVFKVWASDDEGNWYDNAVSYPFTIMAPFYRTLWFQMIALAVFIGVILMIVFLRNRQKTLREAWMQRLREEEQARVRQKTAEDFHDEIGNKLTRINLLATIAENKSGDADAGIKDIFSQIRQNVTSLYNGSKDIIWMLQPQSDYLDEILLRIQQVSEDLLGGSHIKLHYRIVNPDNVILHRKMPIDHSRNMVMIVKEVLNNAVKHSGAENIQLLIEISADLVRMEISDDGKGFDTYSEQAGNGLKNIRNRAARIKAQIHTGSTIGEGTTTVLLVIMPDDNRPSRNKMNRLKKWMRQ